ncbi:VWA domain-containing protein [Rhodoferax sp. GW822-FHT02A01]|uniref:nitric oxide reductase activation protein NorD n=1 Tax=Rhodoferax sp. GW822-FHT02A01 TaxID=3141537 RepID=UPI00315CB78E
MEEHVGLWWHQLLTRMAGQKGHGGSVALDPMRGELGLLFRALGGAHGLKVDATAGTRHGARRSVIERMAGVRAKVELAGVDAQALRLPGLADAYATVELNQALYRWQTALCAVVPEHGSWVTRNQQGTMHLLENYRGLAASYWQLVQAELQRRPDPATLPPAEAQAERSIRQALRHPDSAVTLIPGARAPEPVLLWLAPDARGAMGVARSQAMEPDEATRAGSSKQQDEKRRVAEDADMPERPGGLMMFRPESIFSWSEYAKVQHDVQENEEEDLARAADDLDTLSVSADQRPVARALRMNLDHAAREETGPTSAEPAILLPEWDYKRQVLLPAHCSVRISSMPDAPARALPERLRQEQRRLHHQLAMLAPERQVRRRQSHGDEIDLDALIRARTDSGSDQQDCYQQVRRNQRDLSCLLLADLSLSTDAAISEKLRVIDVIRDSLSLFAESLSDTRDRFALYGFSSRQRHAVNMVELKHFDEPFNARIRGRIEQIKPAFYTRMGAAVRQSSALLAKEKSRERLLLILTDGKPNDNDYYEGRYGIEDTRYALSEARKQGLRPFCVTVDQTAEDYLPHIFGKHSFTIVKRPAELPRRLALLYAQLTR